MNPTILGLTFGGMFLSIAAIFTLGLTPRFALRFYPGSASFSARLAAPVIFAALAVASFVGLAVAALAAVAVLGVAQIAWSRWKARGAR